MIKWDYKKTKGFFTYASSLETLSWLFKSLFWCHRKMIARMKPKQTYLNVISNIFHVLIPTLVRTFRISSFVSTAVSLLTFHTSVILAPWWIYVFRTLQITEHFLFLLHVVLLTCLHGQNQWNYIKDSHQQFEKNTFVSFKN